MRRRIDERKKLQYKLYGLFTQIMNEAGLACMILCASLHTTTSALPVPVPIISTPVPVQVQIQFKLCVNKQLY